VRRRVEALEALWDEHEAREDREDYERWTASQVAEFDTLMATKRYPFAQVCADVDQRV
jgi:hypothetical protein